MKKITAFILMAVMTISLTACGTAKNKASGSTFAAVETANSEQTTIENTEKRDKAGSSGTVQSNEVTETKKTETGSDVLVIYFSHTGTTKKVAEYLHGIVGGDIVEIKPVKAYPDGYSDALDPAKEEQRENARPEIANPVESINSYKTIYLGYPIWWGTVPMIINTFLESYDFRGKTVVPFCTSGGTGNSQSMKDIRAEIPDANVPDGIRVTDKEDIVPWIKNLGLYPD